MIVKHFITKRCNY